MVTKKKSLRERELELEEKKLKAMERHNREMEEIELLNGFRQKKIGIGLGTMIAGRLLFGRFR